MRTLAFGFALLFLVGCHRYVPISSGPQEAGTPVRVALTDHGTAELARFVGPSVAAVQGRLVRGSREEVVLSVTSTELHNGAESYWSGEHVAVPRDAIAVLEERRFSRSRTAFLAGGLTAGGFLLNAALGNVLGIGGGGRNDGRGTTPQ